MLLFSFGLMFFAIFNFCQSSKDEVLQLEKKLLEDSSIHLEIDPSRKRFDDEILASQLTQEEMLDESNCLNGFGDCARCTGLIYYFCTVCDLCCRGNNGGFAFYYTCVTVCI